MAAGVDKAFHELVAANLQKRDATLVPESTPVMVEKLASGKLRLHVKSGDGAERTLDGDQILVAIGRTPSFEGLALEVRLTVAEHRVMAQL